MRETPHRVYDLQKVNYLIAGSINHNDKKLKLGFVFNIADTREAHAKTANKLFETLPPEIVIKIFSYLKCNKPRGDFYEASDFPYDSNFVQEYNSDIPKLLSKAQLKQLYDTGIIKLAYYHPGYISSQMIVLDDTSYDYVYPNNASNYLHSVFETKDDMKEVADTFSANFFFGNL